ncbi:MAG: hypothetical protein PHE89_03430 [Alphaproteobacteria bacterium]|nr:hypothetical protein [Alphaproteobacteria bacterium]
MDEEDTLYEKSDESYELYGKYDNAPSFKRMKINTLEKELQELETKASEENKQTRLEKMRDLYRLYKEEGMKKEENAIVKKGKALAGIQEEKKPKRASSRKKTLTFEQRQYLAKMDHHYK